MLSREEARAGGTGSCVVAQKAPTSGLTADLLFALELGRDVISGNMLKITATIWHML